MCVKSMLAVAILSAGLTGVSAADEGHHHGHMQTMAAQAEQQPWGIAGDPAQVSRTIAISMDDQMRFTPNQIDVKEGETVRFVLPNHGQVMHEFVLGEKGQLDKYAEMVLNGMGMPHGDTGMSHVQPGQSGEVVWTFNRVGTFDFACLIAGHYQAGMVGKVNVSGK